MLHPETVRVFYSKIIYSVILAHHPGANLGNPLLSGRSGDHLRRKLCSSQDCTTKISGIQFFKAFLLQNLPHYWGSSWRTHGLGGQNEPGVPAPSSPQRGGTSTGLSSAGYAEGVCFGPLHPALKSFLQQLAPCNTYLRCCQLLKTWTSTNLVLGGFLSSFHLWFVWRRNLATWQRDLMLLFTIFPPWIEKPALWLRLG